LRTVMQSPGAAMPVRTCTSPGVSVSTPSTVNAAAVEGSCRRPSRARRAPGRTPHGQPALAALRRFRTASYSPFSHATPPRHDLAFDVASARVVVR
jgi:hypothetical protein